MDACGVVPANVPDAITVAASNLDTKFARALMQEDDNGADGAGGQAGAAGGMYGVPAPVPAGVADQQPRHVQLVVQSQEGGGDGAGATGAEVAGGAGEGGQGEGLEGLSDGDGAGDVVGASAGPLGSGGGGGDGQQGGGSEALYRWANTGRCVDIVAPGVEIYAACGGASE